MKKVKLCQKKIVQCVACKKEYTSEEKLFGHLRHYSSQNCRSLHEKWQKKSHQSSVMHIPPQTSEQFPVHQNKLNYSAAERIGRNLIAGVQKDFTRGEIGLEDLDQPEFQQTVNDAFDALLSSTSEPTAPSPAEENDTQPTSNDGRQSTSHESNTSPPSNHTNSEFEYYSDGSFECMSEMDDEDSHRHEDYEEDEFGDMIPLCRPTNPLRAEPTEVPRATTATNPPIVERNRVATANRTPQPRRRFEEYNIKSGDFLNRQKNIKEVRTNLRVDKNTIACLKLQHILHQSNCSMTVYDKVMKWAQAHKDDLYSLTSNPSHSQLVELCAKKLFGQEGNSHKVLGMYPSTQHIKLPTKREVDVTTFSFRKMLCHMLSDSELMKWENLIFQQLGDNRFHVETGGGDQNLGEINTGKWFEKTFGARIEPHPIGPSGRRRILCPIIFYIDGLVIDAYGKLTLEPLTFTLGIFKKKLRNLAIAWRTLGFMEDLDSLYGANLQSPLDKANDYHAILACILEEFKQVQELNEPMPIDIMIEGELHSVDLIFEVAYVIGDCKGLDMLAGRKMSHSTSGLTRLCDCKKTDGDNADVICKLLKYDELKNMSDARLEELSFRRLSPCNAFEGISWGANKRGIIGATPTDALHTILKDGPVGSAIKSIRAEMPKQGLHQMDRTAAMIAVTCSRQSDKNFPSINPFRNGLSKVNKLTADEIYAKTFMYFLVFNNSQFSNYLIDKKFHTGPKETSKKKQWSSSDYRKAHRGLEIVLCFYQWVMKDSHPKSHFEGGRDSVANRTCRKFLAEFLEVLPLHDGYRHQRPKIHLQLHWAFWIIMFGCAKNFDSARCESIAGENVKKHSQKTQKRAVTLNLQTATRITEETIFSDLRKEANINTIETIYDDDDDDEIDASDQPEEICDTSDDPHSHGNKGGSRFTISFDRDTNKGCLTWDRPTTPGHFNDLIISSVSHYLHNFASKEFGTPIVAEGSSNKDSDSTQTPHGGNPIVAKILSIKGFTELKKCLNRDANDPSTFRSIPSFRDGRPWKDWANFKWDIDEEIHDCEARIEMFLDFSSMQIDTYTGYDESSGNNRSSWGDRRIRSIPIDEIETKKGYKGKFVCVTASIEGPQSDGTIRNCMRSKISTRKTCHEQLCFVSTENLFDKAFVIPDSFYDGSSLLPKDVVVYHPIHTWSDYVTDVPELTSTENTIEESDI